MRIALLSVTIFVTGAIGVFAGEDVRTYTVPDVRDDYCGVHINFQYCKCAFHDEYCGSVGTSQNGAWNFVLTEFRKWNRERIQSMGESCLSSGGYWNKGRWSCTTCTDGDVLQGSRCVKPDTAPTDASKKGCELPDNFDTDWEKYSDIDDAIAPSDASYEVGQYHKTLDDIAGLIAQAQALEYDMEVDRQLRLELREYKQALVQNLRNNITKAIFRLAWVTYNTVQAGKGNYGSYEKLVNPSSVVEGVGAGLKLVQSHIPAGAKDLQFDTKDAKGKVKSAAWNATLETLESVGNPQAVATQVMKDVKGAAVGGPDLTDEEVAILRTQHLENNRVDQVLAESYARNAERRAQLRLLEQQIAEKYNELQDWKQKEYTRVRNGIVNDCNE